ncbi:uncharacterized protein CIMG_13103 [Coccidioides immitis RS]|uniref:Uncharacterized protein n=1 Tax=Coccidioides immitis (strain RS) TaxID=246410 RepID=J3K9L4_COCIM|nr:uncharacterized protein CIMG_13103 [Coccidioides immitis RS]EAS31608.3 hypothetical protein CIMG_13103 [Coccidioides immitis RS]
MRLLTSAEAASDPMCGAVRNPRRGFVPKLMFEASAQKGKKGKEKVLAPMAQKGMQRTARKGEKPELGLETTRTVTRGLMFMMALLAGHEPWDCSFSFPALLCMYSLETHAWGVVNFGNPEQSYAQHDIPAKDLRVSYEQHQQKL